MKLVLFAMSMMLLATVLNAQTVPTLAERLGYQKTDKLLIVNCDDVGMSHASNAAVIDGMENGLISSATIMVPCPWFPEIAKYAREHPKSDFGLHLTHTSEWKRYKWGPVASKDAVKGLLDPQGYLWPSVEEVYAHATPEEAYVEAKAQIEKALAAGIDVTHLDSHMGALQYGLPFYAMYRKLAIEYNLPIRMGSQKTLEDFGAGHLRAQLDEDGIVYPDYLIHGVRKKDEPITDYWKRIVSQLPAGVTELYIHAALGGEEMKHVTNRWKERAEEHRLFTSDEEIRQILKEQNVKVVGYRALRDLQHRERKGR